MKKLKKRVMAFLLISAMAVSTAAVIPQTASAATPKATVKSTSLKVSAAKISGFKKIIGTEKHGNYIIAYGTNSKKQNVYAYSTDGKKFSKVKTTGLTGNLSYESAGKYLYVVSTSNVKKASYKCVSNPAKLSSTKAKKINFSLPSNLKDASLDSSGYVYQDTKNNKLYLDGYVTGSDGEYYSCSYMIALSASGAKVTNMEKKTASLLKSSKDSVDYSTTGFSTKTYLYGVITYNQTTGKRHFIYTTNGSSFKASPVIPSSDSNTGFNVMCVNGQAITYRTYHRSGDSDNYNVTSDSKNHGIVYVLDTKKNKWVKRTSGKYTASSGFFSDYNGHYSVYYYDETNYKEYLSLSTAGKNSVKTIVSSDGKNWSSLPKLTFNTTKYDIASVIYEKTTSGTYAIESYYVGSSSADKRFIAISRLSNGKWKKLKTLSVTEGEGYLYSEQLYLAVPSLIYGTPKTTFGYNLKTNKTYTLPFKYTSYGNHALTYDDKVSVYQSGSKLYTTKDGFKTLKKITLKCGSKTVKTAITGTNIKKVAKKTTYLYIICGGKMYYTTPNQLAK